jgi:hypothetical protein
LDKCPKEYKLAYINDTCVLMFIVTLFTIIKLCDQPRCPSTDKWIKNMWYICPRKYYSSIKKNEITPFAGKWVELEIIM